jgi:hypothetical protein
MQGLSRKAFGSKSPQTQHFSSSRMLTSSSDISHFFAKRGGDVLKATEIAKKPRRNISSVIAGKAITEIDVSQKIEEYQEIKKYNKIFLSFHCCLQCGHTTFVSFLTTFSGTQ